MKSAAVVIVALCLSINSLMAQSAAAPKPMASQNKGNPAQKAGAVSTQSPRPVGQPVVNEISTLVLDKKTKGSGLVMVSGTSTGCSSTAFDGQIAVEPDFDDEARGSTAFVALLFLQGVRHEIHGEVCWPSVGLDFRIEGKMDARQVTREGRFVSVGSINAKGTITISGADDPAATAHSKVFRIKSSASRPLVFAVSTSGYRYLSGEGTVTTPSGQKFAFPRR